jgi:uncharacterized protein (TIGR02646 family)
MRGYQDKCKPPEFLAWLARENEEWKPAYPFNESAVRTAVVDSLNNCQRGLCVYCGRKLNLSKPGKSFHIEHFRPQSRFKKLSVDFENLFLSCGHESANGTRSQTCGTYKDQWFEEAAYVDPQYPGCMNFFNFHLSGNVSPNPEEAISSQNMIEKLNLNHPELKVDRAELFKYLDNEDLDESDFWNSELNMAESYAHIAFHYVLKEIP